jgi:hypothetical protein
VTARLSFALQRTIEAPAERGSVDFAWFRRQIDERERDGDFVLL